MGMGWVWDGYGTGMGRVWDGYGTGMGRVRDGTGSSTIIEDAASSFLDPKVVTLLEKHQREYGYEVIDGKHLKYFDIKVN